MTPVSFQFSVRPHRLRLSVCWWCYGRAPFFTGFPLGKSQLSLEQCHCFDYQFAQLCWVSLKASDFLGETRLLTTKFFYYVWTLSSKTQLEFHKLKFSFELTYMEASCFADYFALFAMTWWLCRFLIFKELYVPCTFFEKSLSTLIFTFDHFILNKFDLNCFL